MANRSWAEETHSTGFELHRHFFFRFFESEFISIPGQGRIFAGGIFAILASLSIVYSQAYYHKYLALNQLPDRTEYDLSVVDDVLFLIILSMFTIGFLTTIEWPSLFPGLRDYLALSSLPIRTRDLFIAKFNTMIAIAAAVIATVNLLPSIMVPMMMSGRYGQHSVLQIPGIFVSASLAASFVFFSLVALQGVLLNLLPVREFPRVSLAVQSALLAVFLCGLPLLFSVPAVLRSLHQILNVRPMWALWTPPLWFLGADQVIAGHRDPIAVQLAQRALAAVGAAATAAIGTYFWSYRRHKVRLLEAPALESVSERLWPSNLAHWTLADSRELAVFAFIGKMLGRSRQHRMLLTTSAAIALAIIIEGFVSLALDQSFRGFSIQTPGLRQAAISIPLALSLFILWGFRYLFRLPVELRANWVFQINEPGNGMALLAGVRSFLLYCAVIPIALITLPIEIHLLGAATGILASIVCTLPSLLLMELLVIQLERVPFTSSYLPGRRPVIETATIYSTAVILYVFLLSALVSWSLRTAGSATALMGILAVLWWRARKAHQDLHKTSRLEFEEVPEPAVMSLGIERD